MKNKPLIGITCRVGHDEPWVPALQGVREPYINGVVAAGGIPVLVPLLQDEAMLRELYSRLDGILIPGGTDVDPKNYGESAHPKTEAPSLVRDNVELAFARWAFQDQKPLLGICRGIQVANVALGGTLIQDIDSEIRTSIKHPHQKDESGEWLDLRHQIEISPGSKLEKLVGTSTLSVNSLHHQALKNVAVGLEVVAKAPDGVIEGVEGKNGGFYVAVQCHPETLWQKADPRWLGVFRGLVQAASSK